MVNGKWPVNKSLLLRPFYWLNGLEESGMLDIIKIILRPLGAT